MQSWKWIAAVALAAIVVGCAGGGAENGGGNGGGTGGEDRGVPTVNLSELGELQTIFVSGQGRRQSGSLIAVIKDLKFQNDDDDFIPDLDQTIFPDVRIQLDGYTLNSRSFSVKFPGGVRSRTFFEYPFVLEALEEKLDGGGSIPITSESPAYVEDIPFDAEVTVFPGRQTTVQINLDDSIIGFDNQIGVIFNRDLFIQKNYDVTANLMTGFLSDFLSFDISGLPIQARPNLLNASDQPVGPRATHVHFSGDSVALSAGFDTVDSFQLLDPIRVQNGIIRRPKQLGGVTAPGVYTLEEADPRDISGIARLTALQGYWRNYTEVLSNIGPFAAICIPNSRDEFEQQFIIFSRSPGGAVTSMWQGVARFDFTLDSGEFSLWPIDQVDNADGANEVTGTIRNVVVTTDKFGVPTVRQGEYAVTSTAAGFPFPSSGKFVAFRR